MEPSDKHESWRQAKRARGDDGKERRVREGSDWGRGREKNTAEIVFDHILLAL